jgi:hypothetical protein
MAWLRGASILCAGNIKSIILIPDLGNKKQDLQRRGTEEFESRSTPKSKSTPRSRRRRT